VDPALALDWLDHDRARLAVDLLSHGIQITERGVTEPREDRLNVILRLARGAQGAHGAAMEAIEHRDDLVASGLAMEAGHLDHRLVSLGTAVAEEALGVEAETLDEGLGEQPLGFHVPGVWNVNELRDLFLHRPNHARRTMTEQIAAPAGEEI